MHFRSVSNRTLPGSNFTPLRHDIISSIVKYLPEWLPGASFKTRAREVRESLASIETKLYLVTRAQLVRGDDSECCFRLIRPQDRGDATSSFVADFLNDHETTAEEIRVCQEVSTTLYGGACSAPLRPFESVG